MKPPMPAKTLPDLRASIAHWTRLATGKRRKNESIGAYDCALCVRFILRVDSCVECPVFLKTGQPGCAGTPYNKARIACYMHGLDSPQFRAAAARMLAFLKSLLPKPRRTVASK
jgi:hypothetical protein